MKKIEKDTGRGNFLNAEEAVKYGLVDKMIDKRDIKDVKWIKW